MLTAALLLSACGFQLRGTGQLPFKTLYLQASSTSPFALQLKRAIEAGTSTRVTESPEEAEVVLQILNELQEKTILSLTGGGRVSEFLLRYRVSFRLTDKMNREHIPSSEIVLRQAVTFNDQQELAKGHEEAHLYRGMRSDAVQQLLRRLQATKLQS
ncbi:MAG: LPS assembly lipoprotein LptE [Betaproteobacteria bacterium]|nr:LPS assembly lipoprotein LptE [Betaproteobacteria bacterium]MDH3435848.1 LPS assembly lipoprotein LptE [Betaproteobacteria bacterium]